MAKVATDDEKVLGVVEEGGESGCALLQRACGPHQINTEQWFEFQEQEQHTATYVAHHDWHQLHSGVKQCGDEGVVELEAAAVCVTMGALLAGRA